MNRIVKTESGLIRGFKGNNPVYTVFMGVPYAAPPVGELRWRDPQPVIPWDGVRDAFSYGPIAPQPMHEKDSFFGREFFAVEEERSEDCLYLNIWTPAKTPDDKLPVLLWIHGGGYFSGSGSEVEFDGEGFCKRGVILVTINYRLGALGFLAHPELSKETDRGVSGNYGLLDQLAAIKWVRRNIAAFGGDPDRITVDGQSAGGGCILNLVCSHYAQGQFQRAIIQSGVSFFGERDASPQTLVQEQEAMGVRYMEHRGCKSIAELRALPADRFVPTAEDFQLGFGFAPYTDGVIIPESIRECLKNGHHADVDILTGCNSAESVSLGGMDLKFREGVDTFLELMRAQDKPVYTYLFTREIPGEDGGAFHSGELWYQFSTFTRCWRPMTGKDYTLSEQIADYWAAFVKTGDPNHGENPRWEPVTKERNQWMELGENTGMLPIA